MNPWMLHAMTDSRCQEMRRDAAQHAGGGDLRPAWRLASIGPGWPRMRRQVGYALVEAGLRLLVADGPAPRG
jgi:hypothetical protein